jgi:hypothetical protein
VTGLLFESRYDSISKNLAPDSSKSASVGTNSVIKIFYKKINGPQRHLL